MAAKLWLIAGAEGVGKTTWTFRHIRAVSGSDEFVNLDEFARGISPLDFAEGRGGCVAMRGDAAGLPEPLAVLLDAMPPCPEA